MMKNARKKNYRVVCPGEIKHPEREYDQVKRKYSISQMQRKISEVPEEFSPL